MKLAAIVALLVAGPVLANVAVEVCKGALQREETSPDPTPAEWGAETAARKNAYMLCRARSIPADLRAASVSRWAQILSQRDAAAAEALYRTTIREIAEDHGPSAPALVPLLDGLLLVVTRTSGGPTGEAFRIAYDIRRIAEETHGAESEQAAKALLVLAQLHAVNGSQATAEELYRDAIKIAAAACGPKCGTLTAAYSMLRDLIKDDPERRAEANELDERAIESIPNDQD